MAKRSIRKPSQELLQSVKLKPTYRYESFPLLRTTRSEPGPYFNTPRLAYSSMNDSPPVYPRSPNSVNEHSGASKQMSLSYTSIRAINYFFGVSVHPYSLPLPFIKRRSFILSNISCCRWDCWVYHSY